MGFETRRGRGRYYTRSRRVNGRVVREYIGTGDHAETIARLDALDRARRMAEVEAFRAECERIDEAAATVQVFCDACELLAQGALLVAGYHRHKRGEWRCRRNGKTATDAAA